MDKNTTARIAVVGPNSMSVSALEGNYNAYASEYITVADGVRKVFNNAHITVEKGAHYCHELNNDWGGFGNMISDGVAAASQADVTILALGLDCSIEGEDTGYDNDYTDYGDKKHVSLPATQQKLADAVCDACENVIVVLMCGSSIDVGEKVRNHAKAIIHAWYPGSLGGLSVANLLAGEFSPCGKLPVTMYYGNHNLPDFKDYDMRGKTYRYIEGDALYPFGFGLSYTSFSYNDAKLTQESDETLTISVEVTNVGEMDGIDKVQIYAKYTDSRTYTPHFQLCGVKSVELNKGEKKTVELSIDRYWIKAVTEDGERVTPDGEITLFIGNHQPDSVSNALTGTDCLTIKLQ